MSEETDSSSPRLAPVGDDATAVLMRQEGRLALDNLNQGLSDIDTKASKLMRANIVVAGLILSGFSVASDSEALDAGPFLNSFSVLGMFVLLGSIVSAGVTYTATESRVGISAETIANFVGSGLDQEEVDRGVAKAYARWIWINRRANVKNAFYISITILLALWAIVLISTGVLVGAVASQLDTGLRLGIWLLVIVGGGGIAYVADVQSDYEEWQEWRERSGSPEVISVGTDNSDS